MENKCRRSWKKQSFRDKYIALQPPTIISNSIEYLVSLSTIKEAYVVTNNQKIMISPENPDFISTVIEPGQDLRMLQDEKGEKAALWVIFLETHPKKKGGGYIKKSEDKPPLTPITWKFWNSKASKVHKTRRWRGQNAHATIPTRNCTAGTNLITVYTRWQLGLCFWDTTANIGWQFYAQ